MILSPDVANNAETTDKQLGGITGKGFMPGQSGNPSGRPSRRRMSERYEDLLEQALPEDLRVGLKLKDGATYGDAIVLGQARAAIKGKTDAAREIADRVEGKARQQVDVKGDRLSSGRLAGAAKSRSRQTKPGHNSNPQPSPQQSMSCMTSANFGSPRGFVSC
jgi:hypothetical protein